MTLRHIIARLRVRYGRPDPPPTTDAFELVLWENVAYLATPQRRRDAFDLLKRTVGTTPAAIARAPAEALKRVGAKGILKAVSARKLRECARIASDELDGHLNAIVAGPLPAALRALRAFPGIGVPGAEKVLLFTGRHASLAPESNGLRVLVRMELVASGLSYARAYAASHTAAATLPTTVRAMQTAHLLLRQHGETCCRRTNPACASCPLAPSCPFPARA